MKIYKPNVLSVLKRSLTLIKMFLTNNKHNIIPLKVSVEFCEEYHENHKGC